jgi:hypothetical protein
MIKLDELLREMLSTMSFDCGCCSDIDNETVFKLIDYMKENNISLPDSVNKTYLPGGYKYKDREVKNET